MSILIQSEIGVLRRVLVHHPGQEIDWMVPTMMEELLFDDILYAKQARQEHDSFCSVLERAGVEVVGAGRALREVLAGDEAREELLAALTAAEVIDVRMAEFLGELTAVELAAALISGVRNPAGYQSTETHLYEMAPVPNYFFQRDPQFVIGDRVFVGSMATEARRREAWLAQSIFRHHPALGGYRALFSVSEDSLEPGFPAGGDFPTLEGGDVLVASAETLLVGVSQRTNRRGVERLAEYLREEETPFKRMLVVDLPTRRSYMHLDTVFTFIDHGLCLAYLPVIEPGRRLSCQVFSVNLESNELAFSLRPSLRAALSEAGVEVELVPCGGSGDVLDQAREQWTDGANAFAVAPGVILLYRRNRRTVEHLAARGWRVIAEEDVLAGRQEVLGQGPTVVTFLGNELSRARGGPHCMTMALEREPVSE